MKLRTLLLFVLLCCPMLLGQTFQVAVDGSTNPAGIPDANAYMMTFREMVANTKTTQAQKIAAIGFTDVADVTTFQNSLSQFQAQYASMTGDDQISLAVQVEADLHVALTAEGFTQFQAYEQSYKSKMQMGKAQPIGDTVCGQQCCSPSVTSTYDSLVTYNAPNYDTEWYGDSVVNSTNGCSCSVNVYIAITYNGVVTKGKQGTTSTVSIDVNMGSGYGTVYEVTFTVAVSYCGWVGSTSVKYQDEIAFTKFLNTQANGTGTGCVESGPGWVCTWYVTPNCTSDTTPPDFKYPNFGPPPAWIRDYYFPGWRSFATCKRYVWTGGHGTWLCFPIWPANVGPYAGTTPERCTSNP